MKTKTVNVHCIYTPGEQTLEELIQALFAAFLKKELVELDIGRDV